MAFMFRVSGPSCVDRVERWTGDNARTRDCVVAALKRSLIGRSWHTSGSRLDMHIDRHVVCRLKRHQWLTAEFTAMTRVGRPPPRPKSQLKAAYTFRIFHTRPHIKRMGQSDLRTKYLIKIKILGTTDEYTNLASDICSMVYLWT